MHAYNTLSAMSARRWAGNKTERHNAAERFSAFRRGLAAEVQRRTETLGISQAGGGCGGVWPLHNTAVEGGFTGSKCAPSCKHATILRPYRCHPPLVGVGTCAPLAGCCVMLAVQRHVERSSSCKPVRRGRVCQ